MSNVPIDPCEPPELPCPYREYNVVVQVLRFIDRCPECGGRLPVYDVTRSSLTLEATWQLVVTAQRNTLINPKWP